MMDQLKEAWERLRSMKGGSTWVWLIILFVVLAIGLLMNDPLPPAPNEQGGGTFGSTGLALSVFFRWMAVIGFIYLGFLFLKKWKFNKTGPEQRRITVMERFHLSPKQTLMLVKADGREFLVGATDAAIQLIAEMDPLESATTASPASPVSFESVLSAREDNSTGLNHDQQ